jgi:large subunit ribosomal protein L17
MKHRVVGRKLGRTSAHRTALLRNLSRALLEKERITTTLGKAKELRRFAERLVTLAKRENLHARRRVLRHIHDRKLVAKLFDTLSARYAERPGGYTRILRLGPRRGDHAELALIEFVGAELAPAKASETAKEAAEAAPAKKERAAKGAAAPSAPAEPRARGRKAAARAPGKAKAAAGKAAAEGKAKVRSSKGPAPKGGAAKSGTKATKGSSRAKG